MDQCIATYGGLVWSIAQRYVKDRSSAEDVVQETFTDLWKSAHRYDSTVATESTFVGLLARRRAIDFVRRESRQPVLEPLPDQDTLPQATAQSEGSLRSAANDIRAALKELPEETQQIFALHFDQGMTHPEIAQQTGLPLGTVKTRLRRGLIEARAILRRLDPTQPSTAINP
jgi:RNA polymerase sigma-70 factor (ECF subfamily)